MPSPLTFKTPQEMQDHLNKVYEGAWRRFLANPDYFEGTQSEEFVDAVLDYAYGKYPDHDYFKKNGYKVVPLK